MIQEDYDGWFLIRSSVFVELQGLSLTNDTVNKVEDAVVERIRKMFERHGHSIYTVAEIEQLKKRIEELQSGNKRVDINSPF